MESTYQILGIAPNSTPDQIEAAFQRQYVFWNDLQSNANRAAEAEAMIARLEFARAQALANFKGQEGGLVDPEPTTQRGFGGGGVFASAQGGTTKAVDKDVCPQCGMREDSPDAVFCTNRECRFELKPCCPGCGKRIPWYKEICPYCGIDIEDVKEKTRRKEEEQRRLEREALLTRIQSLKAQLADLKLARVKFEHPGLFGWLRYQKDAEKWAKESRESIGCGTVLLLVSLGLIVVYGLLGLVAIVGYQLLPNPENYACLLGLVGLATMVVFVWAGRFYAFTRPTSRKFIDARINTLYGELKQLEQRYGT
jgi:hypothetical protein